MKRRPIMDIRKTGLMVATLVMMITLTAIIAPTFADISPGDSPGKLRVVPGKVDLVTAKTNFDVKRIRDYRVTVVGDISWCDIRIIHDNPSTPQIDSVTLTTTDPKINTAILTASMTIHLISAKAHKIPTPPGREWPGHTTDFYEIDEVIILGIAPEL